jgi:hypothetical protein
VNSLSKISARVYEEDIAVGSQCELKTLHVRQCVIICESDR